MRAPTCVRARDITTFIFYSAIEKYRNAIHFYRNGIEMYTKKKCEV
nr:MAG TPA: hypothetical protein [Caudoviricetes sp.]